MYIVIFLYYLIKIIPALHLKWRLGTLSLLFLCFFECGVKDSSCQNVFIMPRILLQSVDLSGGAVVNSWQANG